MKKSKLSVGLVTGFIGALALSACDTTAVITAKDGVIIDFVGYNSSTDTIEIKTDLYDEIGHTDEGTKLYYNAILETLIRYEYPILSKQAGSTLKNITLLENDAADKVTAARQTAADNANTNGTTVAEEWANILESHECETDEDLKQHYLYELEKEEITDWYARENIEDLKQEYIGVSNTWEPVAQQTENVNPVYPYHILHVLVTLSADKANYIRGTISQSEAKNLWTVVRQLIDGQYSFQEIAMNKSDDTGSKDQYGDVEIMSTKTSFYNEFKLGVYAYDALLSGNNTQGTDNAAIYKAMGLDSDASIVTETTGAGETKTNVDTLINKVMKSGVKTPVATTGYTSIPTIPYDVFRKIGAVAEDEKIGLFTPEAGDVSLPRNVLYNQFLNFHSPFIITDEDIAEDAGVITTSQHDFENGDLKLASTNFRLASEVVPNAGLAAETKVLCDKDGDVVIGVRSEAGIHFMVMRKSVFKETNVLAGKEETSLSDYYTTYIPGEEEYPTGKETFVNMKKTSDNSYYTNRADTIKNEIKSTSTFDAAYDYRLYEALMENDIVKGKIKFYDYDIETGKSQIQSNIEEYIRLLRETKANADADSINEAWKTYLLMLQYQNTVRSFEGALVPTTCAFHFGASDIDDYKEGGKCYVNKK